MKTIIFALQVEAQVDDGDVRAQLAEAVLTDRMAAKATIGIHEELGATGVEVTRLNLENPRLVWTETHT